MVGYLIAFLTMIGILMQAIFGVSIDKNKDFDLDWTCHLVDAPIIAIILIILVGSNGIYFVVSVGLARSTKNLLLDKVMVRSLQTVETLAYCNELVADKTGCLTENGMDVVSTYLEEKVRKSPAGLRSQDLIKKSLVYASDVTLQDG